MHSKMLGNYIYKYECIILHNKKVQTNLVQKFKQKWILYEDMNSFMYMYYFYI